MRLRPIALWESLRASYWFIPSLMTLAALLLGVLAVWLDAGHAQGWFDGLDWYQTAKPEGARDVLSTIAGSMITVAGVVFSISIVALTYASSQYGPRLLTNFMSDRGNQVTLGTFNATFVYCLVVLRTVRGGDEGSFVPQLAVMLGMLLGVLSIGVLIYFIHHVPQSLHVNHVAARIGRQLIRDVQDRFPELIGTAAKAGLTPQGAPCGIEEPHQRMACERPGQVVGTVTGYVQTIDEERLMRVAREHGLLVRLHYRPGDFLCAGRVLLDLWPADRLDDPIIRSLRSSYTVGAMRTPLGDLDFLIGELVEIATRALSPGINDPTTARTCMDWLGAGAWEIACRQLPVRERADGCGVIRVVAQGDDFRAFIARSFGALRQYAARDESAALHWLRTIGQVAACCTRGEQLAVLAKEVEDFVDIAAIALDGPIRSAVETRGRELLGLIASGLTGGVDAVRRGQADWLGGSAW